MSILNAEEFAEKLHVFIGDRTDEAALEFAGDALDTVTALSQNQGIQKEELEQKLKDNDEAWRRRFMNRFYGGIAGNPGSVRDTKPEKEEPPNAETIGFNDLFS